MRRAIQVIEGIGHQETESALNQFHSYDHPLLWTDISGSNAQDSWFPKLGRSS